MHRIEGLNVKWIDGKSYFGTTPPYTEITPEFLNAIQEEIMTVVEAANLPVLGSSNDTKNQLYTAIAGFSSVPIGCILPWLPGYFTDGNNGGYTAITSVSLTGNWRVCNGSEINDPYSPIFDGAGRFIANLTDDRFLMGDVSGSAGGIGGSSSSAHTHSHSHSVPAHYHSTGHGGTITVTLPDHTHAVYCSSAGSGANSGALATNTNDTTITSAVNGGGILNITGDIGLTTGVDGDAAMTSGSDATAASATENRPKYLSCQYIMRIK